MNDEILKYHENGKIKLGLNKPLESSSDLSKAYTPGVALPCKVIYENRDNLFKYTAKNNLVAVVTDGTAVLGLGDLGAESSIPVMEGKSVLFKSFGDVNAWPVPLNFCREGRKNEGKTDSSFVIEYVKAIAPMYGGINLEDIAAPSCFEIEDVLDKELDVPVFHDDQWGTAVITLAGVMNYCLLSNKDIKDIKVVINGAGAAGIRIAEMIKSSGTKQVVICDSKGVINTKRTGLTGKKKEHVSDTDAMTVSEALKGADIFVGVSVADCISIEDVHNMADYPGIFAMANPDPEIKPEVIKEGLEGRDYVMATGRSDYPNQVNNVLGFPFLFRGALDVRASTINIEMKIAAAKALARVARLAVPEEVKALYPEEVLEFGPNYIIPKPFDKRLFVEVSHSVAEAAILTGVAKEPINLDQYRKELEQRNLSR